MAKFTIYSKDGRIIRYTGCPKYNGTYLQVSYLDFGTINSPTKIDFAVGDFVDYSRTGLRYRLYNLPQPKKQARRMASGESFQYSNVQFFEKTKDLELTLFRDYVIADNHIHFSTNNTVSTYENVYGIVNRIQACLDDMYPNEWIVRVFDGIDEDFRQKITESMNFSVSGSVFDACNKLYDLWGIGWIHTVEGGKDVLTFGRPNKRSDANTTNEFIYGEGNGLTAIRKSIANQEDIATRLYVYGSTRNMLSRYYNGLNIKDADSVDIQHLMIPLSHWGLTGGLPDAQKAYLESNVAILKYGLIPKIVYFDGTQDLPEIYPSLEGVTIADIWGVLPSTAAYYPKSSIYTGAERVDQVKAAVNPTDDGKESGTSGAKYLETKTYFRPATNNDPASIYGTPVTKTYTLFSNQTLNSGDILRIEGGQTGFIEDREDAIRNLVVKVIVRDSENEMSLALVTRHQGSRYLFTLPNINFDKGSGPITATLQIDMATATTETRVMYVTIPAYTYRLGTYYDLAETFILTVPQMGFDLNEQISLASKGKCTIAMKTGMCVARSFSVKEATYRPNTDDWQLVVYRTTDDSLNEKFPNSNYPIAAGDSFVMLDIAMPPLYIQLAMQKLYAKGMELFNEINHAKNFYEPEVDAKKMAASGWSIKEGMYMHLNDTDLVDDDPNGDDYVLIDTLTIAEDEREIPTYKVTLREEKRKSFQQTTKEAISSLKETTAIVVSQNTEYANRAGSADYASRAGDADKWAGHDFSDVIDQSVRTTDQVQFAKVTTPEVKSPNYSPGMMGAGFGISNDNNGNSTLEIDNVIVRKAMTVFELIIQQIKHQGGIVFYSAASMECTSVTNVDGGYKCFFDTKRGQVPNEFVVGDQARCQRFNLGTTQYKYYWRLVTEVGDDYIVLSESDCDTNSGYPAAGDVIVQCGNRTNRQRQAVKVTTCMGDNTPRDEYYKNVDSYNLSGKLVTVVGVKDGVVGIFTNQGRFEGEVVIGSGSTGLGNLAEWNDASQRISDAWQEALNAQQAAGAAQDTADEALRTIQSYIDQVNNDSIFDLTEKNLIRKEWIAINGIESTMRTSRRGSYYLTKHNFENNIFTGDRTVFVYDGVEYTHNNIKYFYKVVGMTQLDATYKELRSYLNEVQLNDRGRVFVGFDREKLADLLTNYYDAEQRIRDIVAQNLDAKIDNTKTELQNALADYQSAVNAAISDIQDQIDGVIDTWFYEYDPTTSNAPASDWTTEELKKEHIGDLFYNNATGKAFRWIKDSSMNEYRWQELSDDAIARALALAQEAKDTADGKRRVFYRQPLDSESYDPGDLWVDATYGTTYSNDILRCRTGKASGVVFRIADWVRASKYTDDTVALDARQKANAAQTAADNAAQAATAAATAASNAQTAANNANTQLTNWANDNLISPTEKEALRQQWKDVQTEKVEVCAEAYEYRDWITDYQSKVDAYVSAYDLANTAFAKYTATTPENITIESDYADIAAYYDARVLMADIVAKAAKDRADEAAADAADAWEAARNAQQTADDAKDSANRAIDALAKLDDDSILTVKEKVVVRREWVAINGVESTTHGSQRGTYYQTLMNLRGVEGKADTIFTYRGRGYSYNGVGFTYGRTGEAQLTAAYIELRSYLAEIELNDKGSSYNDFDHDKLTRLFGAYYDAEAIANNRKVSAVADFIETDYKEDMEKVKEQVDGKAETWVQSSDPSTAWLTDEDKNLHVGDLWLNTTLDDNGNTHTYVYRKNGNNYRWEEMNGVPEDVFDIFDGKASIYVTKPTSYKKNDLWILEANYTLGGVALQAGTIVVATRDSDTWSATHWVKKDRYTDDSALTSFINGAFKDFREAISQQVDGKAETWVQSSDPASSWTTAALKNEHIGDMWLNTSSSTVSGIGSMKTAIYSLVNGSCTWVQQNIPNELFDQIDGKACIFITLPASNVATGDLLIPNYNFTYSGKTYHAGRVYKWNGSAWVEVDYVDTDTFDETINTILEVLDGFASDGQIDESEKRTLARVLADETQNRLDLVARATPYTSVSAVSTALAAFNRAFSATSGNTGFPGMKEVIEYYTSRSGNVAISSSYPLSKITTFYEKRNLLIQAIDAAEKELIDSKDNTQTTIKNGLITSGTIELGDGSTVKAGITGAGTAGTSIRIWAGETFDNRANAPFRVTQNGKLYATNAEITGKIVATSGEFTGKIVATSGTIGGFNIGSSFIGLSNSAGGSPTQSGMSLYSTFIAFSDNESNDTYFGGKYYSFVGSNVMPSMLGIRGLARFEADGSYGSSNNAVGTCIGVYSSVIGFRNQYAWYCPEGVFAGFRPNIKLESSSFTLNNFDSVVVCSNSSAMTVTLPSSPKHGQMYMLLHPNKTSLTVTSTVTHPIFRISVSNNGWDTSHSSTALETIILWYDAHETVTYSSATRTGLWYLTYLKL